MTTSTIRNLGAESRYRAVWSSYVLTSDPAEQRILEKLMDSLQPEIADTPSDPRWQEFADSLPGYRDFWSRFRVECDGMIAKLERKRDELK